MFDASDQLLKATQALWEKQSGNVVSVEDAKEILYNTTGLFMLLQKLEDKYEKTETKI